MEQKQFFTSLDSEDLKKLIHEAVDKTINDSLIKLNLIRDVRSEEELLSRKEVATIYDVSYVTLRDWEQQGVIPKPIRRGSRVYWLRSDIMNDLSKK